MKNKTSLMLMELLVMVLVFALASAICLRVFARSHEISLQAEAQDRAVQIAQNAAETVKACADLQEAAHLLGAREQDGVWILTQEDYSLQLEKLPSGTAGLGRCEITVIYEDTPFSLNTCWQEVAP